MEISLPYLTSWLTILATMIMAITAAIQGVRQNFDPFGVVVLAIVTSVGGGSLRDLLIGSTPVFWIVDMTYISVLAKLNLLNDRLRAELADLRPEPLHLVLLFLNKSVRGFPMVLLVKVLLFQLLVRLLLHLDLPGRARCHRRTGSLRQCLANRESRGWAGPDASRGARCAGRGTRRSCCRWRA